MSGHDPFVILEKLAKEGLEHVAFEIRVDGHPVVITDAALEAVLSDALPDVENVPPDMVDILKAAVAVAELSEKEVSAIVAKSKAGDEWAMRAYQAIVLRELVKLRIVAKRLIARAKKGDASAKRAMMMLATIARNPSHPGYHRARISIWLLRDAKRDSMRPAPEPEETEQVEGEETEETAA